MTPHIAPAARASNAARTAKDCRMTRTCRLLVRGKNVHPETLLATDYLNHFNEVVMLMEMVPAMPECIDDLRAWRPKAYGEHFRDSAFTDRELAVLAYENAPLRYRVPFDQAIERLDRILVGGVKEIVAAIDSGRPDLVEHTAAGIASCARALIEVANGIIHGHGEIADQCRIDAMLISPEQAAVDALFN